MENEEKITKENTSEPNDKSPDETLEKRSDITSMCLFWTLIDVNVI